MIRYLFDTFRFWNDVRTNLERTWNESVTKNDTGSIENLSKSDTEKAFEYWIFESLVSNKNWTS